MKSQSIPKELIYKAPKEQIEKAIKRYQDPMTVPLRYWPQDEQERSFDCLCRQEGFDKAVVMTKKLLELE